MNNRLFANRNFSLSDGLDEEELEYFRSYNYKLAEDDGAYLIDYSPTTTQGQRTISVEESWNLGGVLGLDIGFTGGISGSVGTSYSVEDMTIRSLCGNDNGSYNNASWEFALNTDNYDESIFSGLSLRTPPQLGIGGYKSAQCWQWKVEKPGRYSNIKLFIDLGFNHTMNSYKKKGLISYPQDKDFFNGWFSEFITIRPPRRSIDWSWEVASPHGAGNGK